MCSRSRRAAAATSASLDSVRVGSSPPYVVGQNHRSWRRAALWNVRAWTPGRAEAVEAAAHLAGRAGREGDREHLGGRVEALGDAVGDPVGDRARLAGAGAGQHPDRAAQRLGDLPLLGVEGSEEVGCGSRCGTTPGATMVEAVHHSRRRKGQSLG